jgi:hypothetical protein
VALILRMQRCGVASGISVAMLCCDQICVGRRLRIDCIGAQAAGSRLWARRFGIREQGIVSVLLKAKENGNSPT